MSPVRIKFQQDEKQGGKRPEGRSSITKEREWNPDYREKSKRHPDVYRKVEKEYRGYRIAIRTRKPAFLSLGNKQQPHQ